MTVVLTFYWFGISLCLEYLLRVVMCGSRERLYAGYKNFCFNLARALVWNCGNWIENRNQRAACSLNKIMISVCVASMSRLVIGAYPGSESMLSLDKLLLENPATTNFSFVRCPLSCDLRLSSFGRARRSDQDKPRAQNAAGKSPVAAWWKKYWHLSLWRWCCRQACLLRTCWLRTCR